MSQDCFLNSKDGKNFGSSCGLSGLVRLSECNESVAIFKVTDKDTCLFVRNSHTVFYSNGMRSGPFQKE